MKRATRKSVTNQPREAKTETLRGRVPVALKKRVLELADKTLSSEGQIVRQAVVEWLDRQEKEKAVAA